MIVIETKIGKFYIKTDQKRNIDKIKQSSILKCVNDKNVECTIFNEQIIKEANIF